MEQPSAVGIDLDLDESGTVMRIEEAIAALDGIEAVRLVPGERRPIDELHVVVSPEREPKTTVRDLQSLLTAGFGIEVDRRVISVVQLPADTGQRLRAGLPRLVLETVQIEVRGTEASVTVHLLDGAETIRGAAGPFSADSIVAATAEAALDAIETLRPEMTLRLLGAELASVGAERVAVAAIDASQGRTRDLLTGSAVVRGSEPDAVARAVLDATNRLRQD